MSERQAAEDVAPQRCYVHTFVTIDQCGCPPDPSLRPAESVASASSFQPMVDPYKLAAHKLARRIIATAGKEAQTEAVRKVVAEVLADLDEKIALIDGTGASDGR